MNQPSPWIDLLTWTPDGKDKGTGAQNPFRVQSMTVQECLASDVAIVVKLVPDSNADSTTVQQEVTRILEAVRQASLDWDMVRPVVGILVMDKSSALYTAATAWAANQDWHQGRFSLYVVVGEGDEIRTADAKVDELTTYRGRLRDVLDPQPITIQVEHGIRLTVDESWRRMVAGIEQHSELMKGLVDALNKLLADDGKDYSNRKLDDLFGRWSGQVHGLLSDKEQSKPAQRTGGAETLGRVNDLTIQGYRGIPANRALSLSALGGKAAGASRPLGDIVLLTGSNGSGKTTLLGALGLVITRGLFMESDDQNSLFHRPSPDTEDDADAEFSIAITGVSVPDDQNVPDDQSVDLDCKATRWSGQFNYQWNSRLRVIDNQLVRDAPGWPSLDLRLAAYFQDRVDELFDQTTSGTTLRQVIEPLPDPIRDISRYLPDRMELLKRAISRDENQLTKYSDPGKIQEDWQKLVDGDLGQLLRDAIGLALDMADLRPRSSQVDAGTQAEQRWWLAKIPEDIKVDAVELSKHSLKDLLQQMEKVASTERSAARAERARKRAKRTTTGEDVVSDETLRHALQTLEEAQEEHPFLTRASDALDRVLEVYKYRQGLSRLPAGREVAHALATVDEDACKTALQSVQSRLKDFEDAAVVVKRHRTKPDDSTDDLARKIKRLTELITDIDKVMSGEQLADDARTAFETQRDRDQIQARIDHNQKLVEVMEVLESRLQNPLASSSPWHEDLRRSMNRVAGRFHFAGEIVPISLSKSGDGVEKPLSFDLAARDGRTLAMMSTGQKGQLGVSFMVGQNLAVTKELGHRILLLDDVTTAYDLTNIAREAVVWRQMAYGYNDNDPWPAMRRQLFICSHHDDMSNHLIDLLVPPAGKSMTVLRIVGWSQKDGPVVERYEVVPTLATPVGNGEANKAGVAGAETIHRMAQHIREVLQ